MKPSIRSPKTPRENEEASQPGFVAPMEGHAGASTSRPNGIFERKLTANAVCCTRRAAGHALSEKRKERKTAATPRRGGASQDSKAASSSIPSW